MKRLLLVLAALAAPHVCLAADTKLEVLPSDAKAVLECFNSDGWLARCRVVEETPKDKGVGAAALKFSACTRLDQHDQALFGPTQPDWKIYRLPLSFAGVRLPIDLSHVGCVAEPNLDIIGTSPVTSGPVPDAKMLKLLWVRVPNGDDYAANYPPAAQDAGVQGFSVLDCAVAETGLLADCVIVREAPACCGFGLAALRMSKFWQMRDRNDPRVRVENGRWRTTISWVLAQ